MKALVYTGPHAVELRDVPQPDPGPGEALIKIEAAGICGSDMHAYHGHDARRPAPLVLGHEAAGTVHGGALDGSKVTINPLVSCGKCRYCVQSKTNLCIAREIISMPPRAGAFCEWLTMPTGNLVAVPDHISFAQAALAEPLAVCWHGVGLAETASASPAKNSRYLVIGGGAIGFGSALSAAAFGVEDITLVETNPLRAEHLRSLIHHPVITPDEADESGYDVVIDAVGYGPTRALASKAVRPGGVICHLGLGDSAEGLDVRRITLQEITFFGAYTYTEQDFRDTCGAMFTGKLGDLNWPEQRPLAAGPQAFQDIDAGRVMAPKIVLVP